eukprot:GEMP01064317.1.p1 GENE.GEMP01064317.1~~GEMP01064317.1.p1  ORF type:complete len:162 (+),score=18.99 GEMP01064317.1:110-595(+)
MVEVEDFRIHESPIFVKMLGIATGAFLSICCFLSFFWLHIYPLFVVIHTYLILFGIFVVIMEANTNTRIIGKITGIQQSVTFRHTPTYRPWLVVRAPLYNNFGLIRTASGRGVLYMITGALVTLLLPGTLEWQIIDFLLGGSLFVLGILSTAAHYFPMKRA